MSFIGIISDNKDFEHLRNICLKSISINNLNIINLNKQTIENLRNVKFDAIIINSDLSKIMNKTEILKNICDNTKYVILNSDICLKLDYFNCKETMIITYGLNQKATITASSITEDNILVAVQRNIKNIYGDIIDVQEININRMPNDKIYQILVTCILKILYKSKK